MEKEIIVKNLSELSAFAKDFLTTLSNHKNEHATVLALSGDLGAGKTTFVQTLAKELGVVEIVTSPTFTIMKGYQMSKENGFSLLIHMDAYRIESLEELRPLRFAEILADKNNLICIEWAERINTVLPQDTIHLDIKIIEEEKRKISIS